MAAIRAVATAHIALALGAFAQAYALGDAAMPVPCWLVANAVLGFPVFLVVPTSAMIALRPWLGDDTNGLLLLFTVNGLFWAMAHCLRRPDRPAAARWTPATSCLAVA